MQTSFNKMHVRACSTCALSQLQLHPIRNSTFIYTALLLAGSAAVAALSCSTDILWTCDSFFSDPGHRLLIIKESMPRPTSGVAAI